MSRNKEKQMGRLNRLFLEKEETRKNVEHRPRLQDLHTADAIKQSLPIIKQELDFYLKQSECRSYTDRHVEQYKKKVTRLVREYHTHARKLKQLGHRGPDVPGVIQPYKSQRKYSPKDFPERSSVNTDTFLQIHTPLFDDEAFSDSDDGRTLSVSDTDTVMVTCSGTCSPGLPDIPNQDEPLQFSNSLPTTKERFEEEQLRDVSLENSSAQEESIKRRDKLFTIFGLKEPGDVSEYWSGLDGISSSVTASPATIATSSIETDMSKHVLGINYSSSDDDE